MSSNTSKTILLLAANPKGTTPVRLDEEVREIDEGLLRARQREQFELVQRWAVRPRDVYRAMLDEKPQIVHFSGHGAGEEGLVFEDEVGQPQLVVGEALAGLFKLFAAQVECVVLNGCYSQVQAKAVAQHIPYVIGMKQALGDKAAIAFAVGFYDALGAGETIEFAHELGCNAIQMQGITEHLRPVLFSQKEAILGKPSDSAVIEFQKIIDMIRERKNKKIDVITISANNYDCLLEVDRISPEHESVIENKFYCAGGSGANTVCGLSKLGKNTAIVGCVNNDDQGLQIKASFDEFRVNRDLLFPDENDIFRPNTVTGNTLILVERITAKRQILVTPGINSELAKIINANNGKTLERVIAQVQEAKILHLTSFASQPEMELQSNILERVANEEKQIIVSFTPGAIYVAQGLNRLANILANTHIMFLYLQQLDTLLQRSLENREIDEFRNYNMSIQEKTEIFFDWRKRNRIKHPMIVVIKDYSPENPDRTGYQDNISVAADIGGIRTFLSPPPNRFNRPNITKLSQDTTGAGDALAAGFLYGILEGENIETCADFGYIISREASRDFGARSNLPDADCLRRMLPQQGKR